MSSPAALLAQKHAEAAAAAAATATPEPAVSETSSAQSVDFDSATSPSLGESTDGESTEPVKPKKKLNMLDEKSFPSLGNSFVKPAATSSWGANGSLTSSAKTFKPAVKSSSTQLTFIVDAAQQKNFTATERHKIMSNIMSTYNVKIESTYSSTTEKRTFLVSGKNAAAQEARKQIIKQITKPTELEFSIPSKLRSTIIGSRGKNLNPIIQSTGVKIDIERDSDSEAEFVPSNEDEELFGKSLKVTIVGDIEGCQDAKRRILSIVNENTKNLNVRVSVDEKVKRFVGVEISKLSFSDDIEVTVPQPDSRSNTILIAGPREAVVDTRNKIKSLLKSMDSKVILTEKSVPKHLHETFDVAKLLDETNVVVEIPSEDDPSTIVKFTGLAENIPKAVELGRKMTSDYVIETLNLSKSHGGNVEHAKHLCAFFAYSKNFDALSSEYKLKIKGPSYKYLVSDGQDVNISLFSSKENKDSLKNARKAIIESVNKINPTYVRVIDSIESFLFAKIDNSVAVKENVAIVPLGSLSNSTNKLLLVCQQDDDEFLPSAQEIVDRLDRVEQSLSSLKSLSESLVSEVIEVPSSEQKHLDGSSLKLLLNKFEPNTIEIKLHQNSNGFSDNEVYLRGYKSAITNAIDDIKQLIEDIKNYEEASKYNTVVQIPSKYLSRFIGQKGQHLNELRDEFDVKIDVLFDEGDKAEEADVKLTGLKSNVDELTKKIAALAKRWADETTVVMNIDPKYHRKLIGPNGIYINRLQDKYNVKILFPYASAEKKSEVLVRGPSRGVAKAEDEMNQLLDYEKENGFNELIEIPRETLGNVIGKKGETLNDISADTGVEIQVEDSKGDSETVPLSITGSKKGIQEAKKKIFSISNRAANFVSESIEIDSKWYRNLIGPSGLTKREIMINAGGDENDREFRRLLQFPAVGSESKLVKLEGNKDVVAKIISRVNELVAEFESVTEDNVLIPKKLHRFVIGPAGSVKAGVEKECNVKINIPHKSNEKEEITVKGTPENIEKATKKINELIEGKK